MLSPKKAGKLGIKQCLIHQFGISWQLFQYHLKDLTTQECLWRPKPTGIYPTLLANGRWKADFPATEDYHAGPPNIAWLLWHIEYWWSMTLDHNFGDQRLDKDNYSWYPDIGKNRESIERLKNNWLDIIANLSDEELLSATISRWPLADSPFMEIVAWLNLELMKNAAEIGYIRFLYASQ